MATLNSEEETIFNTLKERYGLNGQVANILARDRKLLGFFNETVEELNAPITIANLVTNEVAKELKEKEIDELKFSPKEIAQLSKMVDDEVISNKIAKQVYEEMVKSGEKPLSIVENRDLKQISSPKTLLPIIYKVISNHPKNLERYRCGNDRLFGFFVGEVLKATDGKANPKVVSELMKKSLESNRDM
jgi:glutaminyl-tRNA synthetase